MAEVGSEAVAEIRTELNIDQPSFSPNISVRVVRHETMSPKKKKPKKCSHKIRTHDPIPNRTGFLLESLHPVRWHRCGLSAIGSCSL
jgi:hypothetical protein